MRTTRMKLYQMAEQLAEQALAVTVSAELVEEKDKKP